MIDLCEKVDDISFLAGGGWDGWGEMGGSCRCGGQLFSVFIFFVVMFIVFLLYLSGLNLMEGKYKMVNWMHTKES